MRKKYLFLIWILILNSSNQVGFSKNYIKDRNFKTSESINIKQSLTLGGNSNNLIKLLNNKFIYLAENLEKISKDKNKNLEAADIFSDTQFNNEKYTIAEGNVLVIFKNLILSSDKLEYNRETNIISIKGNIKFKSNNQFLEASIIEYDFKKKEGFIKDAFGRANFATLNKIAKEDNLKINTNDFKNLDKSVSNVKLQNSSALKIRELGFSNEEKSTFEERLPKSVDTDINEMPNWRFYADRIEIKNDTWTAKKLFLTNDPFNKPQLIINNSKFSASDNGGEILVKSEWSTIELDNFIKIPTGPKRFSVEEETQLKWGLGYDENSKDGLFISRNADTIFIDKNKTKIDIKKVFFLQRALLGKTKSFSKKNDSVLGKKIEQDTESLDLMGLETKLKAKLFDFDFNSDVELNSLDVEKFKKIISVDSELSKIIYEDKENNMEKKTSLHIFGNYRDKLWNSSLDREVEVLSSYGTRIEKKNFWNENNINKSSNIELGYGNYQAGKIEDSSVPIDRKILNISLERIHKYPIWIPEVDKFITSKNKYSPKVIQKGIRFFVQTKADFVRYSDENFQNLYTLRAGPEFTLGEFKNKYLDYTKFRILGKTKIAEGESPFRFDQTNDENSIELIFEQQLIGPLTFKLSTDYNLHKDSLKYKEFHKKKFEINWNRRAYNLSAYYSEDKKTGGITFKIHGFNFDGLGKSF